LVTFLQLEVSSQHKVLTTGTMTLKHQSAASNSDQKVDGRSARSNPQTTMTDALLVESPQYHVGEPPPAAGVVALPKSLMTWSVVP